MSPKESPRERADRLWEAVGYTDDDTTALDAAEEATRDANDVAYHRGRARYLAEHPPKEARP